MSQMKMIARVVAVAIAAAATWMMLLLPTNAWAQETPTFDYADDKIQAELASAEATEWKASAQGGLVFTTGNTEITSISGGAKASRKWSGNKLQLEVGGTYVDARNDDLGPLSRLLFGRARYDRFLTEQNSLYATGSYLTDEPAGKEHVGGGQLGYSRVLFTNDKQEMLSEAGYDFSYEVPVGGDGVAIHSARVFVGYTAKLTEVTGVDASVEALFNVNSLEISDTEVGSFEDARINAKAGLTTKLFEDISFRFAIEARYDNAPSIVDGNELEELDTKTEASIIINLL